MLFLKRQNFEACQEFLKRAESVAIKGYYRALTLNNWACFYRSMGKLRNSLRCLGEALEIETNLRNYDNMANNHLNLCVSICYNENLLSFNFPGRVVSVGKT